jgi:hypothetical protein
MGKRKLFVCFVFRLSQNLHLLFLCVVRYKAEIDFDGAELARSYLRRQDLSALLHAAKQIQTEQACPTTLGQTNFLKF